MALLQSKVIAETITVTFDFTSQVPYGESVSSPTMTVQVLSGVDPSPMELISGSASRSGTVVKQHITQGLGGCVYALTCTLLGASSRVYTVQHTLAVLSNDGSFQPGHGLEIVGTIDATACINEAFYNVLDIQQGYAPFGPVTVYSGALPVGWTAIVVDSTIVISGITAVEAVYNFVLKLVDFAGNVAYSTQTITTIDCFIPPASGDIYVGNSVSGVARSYYLVDSVTNTIVANGPLLSYCYYLTVNYAETRLYAGRLGATYCGYITIATGLPTYFSSVSGNMVIDATETYAYCHVGGTGSGTMRQIDISTGLETRVSVSNNVSDMCMSPDYTKIYCCVYEGGATANIFRVYSIASGLYTNYHYTSRIVARGIDVTPDGQYVFVTCTNSTTAPRLMKIYTIDGTVALDVSINSLGVGDAVTCSPNGAHVAVSRYDAGTATVWIFSTTDLSLLYTIPCAQGLKQMKYSADGSVLYITAQNYGLVVCETTNYTSIAAIPITGAAFSLAIAGEFP